MSISASHRPAGPEGMESHAAASAPRQRSVIRRRQPLRPRLHLGRRQQVPQQHDVVLSSVIAANPDARAWHYGPTDAAGFAAMGVAETLLHTHDITEGMGLRWRPPQSLCEGVLSRLFPDAPEGDPAQVLLWCTGRADLDGRSRRTSWVWSAAVS